MNLKIAFAILFFLVLFSGCTLIPETEKGTLQLTSSPPGAEVYLDNQYRGTTPCSVTGIEPGQHTLEFRSTGYESWSSEISVSPGTADVFAALSPAAGYANGGGTTATPAKQAKITLRKEKDPMLVGESNTFSGTATDTTSVSLTLFGPGKYKDGISLGQHNISNIGTWSYRWNPGSSVLAGSYTMMAVDAWKTTSEKTDFSVIGGGVVSISASTYAAAKGQTITFSGQCTTGAPNVVLVLYGPGQFASGSELSTVAVNADNNWNFKYTLDSTMPTGQYTMNVRDVPMTSSGNVQFTVGYVS